MSNVSSKPISNWLVRVTGHCGHVRDISLAAGFAGPQVAGITVDTESHGVVTASVAGGRFALWFPGDELENRTTIPAQVTYADGSTATVNLEL